MMTSIFFLLGGSLNLCCISSKNIHYKIKNKTYDLEIRKMLFSCYERVLHLIPDNHVIIRN